MTPTQDFENYPEFANSGQKSQPNDAKYAAGFIPSDVLPAEWLNWFLNGATKGVTALNTGVKSVEQEINAVLESRSVTPNINAAGQLLSVLNKIKEEAINEAWPVGITYVQYPQQKSPQELFPKTTWQEISYDGAFFRASGGNAAAFIEKSGNLVKQDDQNKAHSHGMDSAGNHQHSRGTMNIVGSISGMGVTMGASGACYVSSAYSGPNPRITSDSDARTITFDASRKWTGSTSEDGSHSHTVHNEGGNEARPSNFTIRIWKRTS